MFVCFVLCSIEIDMFMFPWKCFLCTQGLSVLFIAQVQHKEQLERLEKTIESKEEELGELLPTYNHLKTEENECTSRY